MAKKNNPSLRGTVAKRDKAYDTLVFNKSYPDVAAKLIDEKNDKALKQQELQSKKRLLPLEIAALSPAERNEVLYARELEDFAEKQKLPRRAVQQTFIHDEKKKSKSEAESRRNSALEILDGELKQKETEIRAKYPTSNNSTVPKDALAAYEQAAKEEDAKLAALVKKQQADKKEKLNRINTRLSAQNKKVQAAFDISSKKLHSDANVNSEKLGKGNILSIQNLKMYFSGIKAVDDLSFNIKEGEIFGLIGPNGAGKTTVFNCVTQFYKPTAGGVYYRDRFDNAVCLQDYKTPDVIKAGIARTFQNLEMVYTMPIIDNLLVGAHAFYRANLAHQFVHTGKLNREEEVFKQRAVDILDRLGILAYKDFYPMGLPYGVLKKVELARTLMSGPRMIILDEPAAGLNDAETEELAEIIHKIRDDFNCTILLVEHDMNLVMGICDTVCAISFGKMLAIGTPEQVQDSPLVQEAYLGTE